VPARKQTAGSKDFPTLAPQYAVDMQLLQLLTATIRMHFLLRQLCALSVVTVTTDRLPISLMVRRRVNMETWKLLVPAVYKLQ